MRLSIWRNHLIIWLQPSHFYNSLLLNKNMLFNGKDFDHLENSNYLIKILLEPIVCSGPPLPFGY